MVPKADTFIDFFFPFGAGMDKNLVAVIICYRGNFVISTDEWDYEGGNEGTIFLDVRTSSYVSFVRDIVHILGCKVGKLLYCVPGKGLRDGLRLLLDESGFKDLIYHYLHGNEAKVYVDSDSDSDDEDDDNVQHEDVIETGEVGLHSTSHGGDDTIVEGHQEWADKEDWEDRQNCEEGEDREEDREDRG